MNVLLTTCKNRRDHLRIALQSWRSFLPGWVPWVVAVDDPEAVDITSAIYGELPWHAVADSHPGFSRLLALRTGVYDLDPSVDRVAIFDCDIVAILGTAAWLDSPLLGHFRVASVAPAKKVFWDDCGVVLVQLADLRAAFDLLGNVDDWEGYGWEDLLLRYALWFVTGGKIIQAPAAWAHIQHSWAERSACYSGPGVINGQASLNYGRLHRDLNRMAAARGVDLITSTITHDCGFHGPLPP